MILASHDRIVKRAIAVVFALFFVWFAISRFGLMNLSGDSSDLTLDWLVVNAAVDGQNPYLPSEDLAASYGVQHVNIGGSEDAERVHPRPPGAILLLLPLFLVSPETIHVFSLVINTIAAVAFLFAVAAATSVRSEWLLLATPLLVLSHWSISAFEFGTQSFVVSALVVVAVGLLRESDSILGGVALGLAITLKLWPALLLILMLRRNRQRSAVAAAVTSGGLALLGIIVFRLSPLQVWEGFTNAGSTWVGFPANGSLGGRFALLGMSVQGAVILSSLVLVTILLWLWNRIVDLELALWGTVAIALLAAPMSWDHYNVILIPIAILLLRRSRRRLQSTKWTLLAWVTLGLGGRFFRLVIDRPVELAGSLAFVERVLILVAVLQIVGATRREAELGKHAYLGRLNATSPSE